MSGKMAVTYKPRWAPSYHLDSPFSSWRFLGIPSVALVLLLPLGSDACDDPPRFHSMMFKGPPQTVYQPGDRAEYECRLGYMPIVPPLSTTAVCQADDTWTPLLEACKRKQCQQLGDPVNGQVVYVNGNFEFGSEAHYECNEGYHLLGTNILYCELSGSNVEWSDNPPQCERILCKPPGEIPNGMYTNSGKDTYEYNEVVTYSCNPTNGPDEYSLVGKSTLICSGQDQWSSDPPECKVIKCPYPVLKNGRPTSAIGSKFSYEAKVTFECLQGFLLEGRSTVVCGANSTWEPEMPICIKDACDDPPRFHSMMLRGPPQTVYQPEDTVEYDCRLGYMPIVPPLSTTAVCQADKTWTPLQEACTKKSCVNLAEPVNGEVIYVNGSTTFGSEAHYRCNEGFYLLGTNILYCELSGDSMEWSDNPPQCERILCKPPEEIPNGMYTNSGKDTYEYNEVVTYNCNPSDGPDEYSLVGESTLICSGQDQWSSDPPECKVVKCPYPVVNNERTVSEIETEFNYKARVTFECLQGYLLEGSSTVECGASSTWEPELPNCTEGVQPNVPKPTPVSRKPGVKPNVPKPTPVSRKPGHYKSSAERFEYLGGRLTALIVLMVCSVPNLDDT